PETFNNFSVDVYPVSRTIRIGLTSAFGWQSGTWLTNGDYFATQTVSLGAQYRDFGRVVPFAEGFAGVGYMRRLQFDRTIPTAFWQFGVDAGAEVYVARVGYLSFAIGIYIVFDHVTVYTSFWRFFGSPGTSFGLTLIPLLGGIGVLFFNGRSVLGWLLTVGGVALILVGVLMNLDIYFRPTSLWGTI